MAKLCLFLCLFFVVFMAGYQVLADFAFNDKKPKELQKEKSNKNETGLKCIPGHTVILVKNNADPSKDADFFGDYDSNPDDLMSLRKAIFEKYESVQGDDDAEIENSEVRKYFNSKVNEDENKLRKFRRTHSSAKSFETDDGDHCQICVCSVDGKDEYCHKRPAKNVNECIRIERIKDTFGSPYLNKMVLSQRVRRDYIWHKDELPYDPHSLCRRGTSYYTNKQNASTEKIDLSSESLLDYEDVYICYYCICDATGSQPVCLERDPWICQYYRDIRDPAHARDRYAKIFEQDRPAYFRHISWRVRRVLDQSMFDVLGSEGDALCCNHNTGHLKTLHNMVRDRVRQMRRKVHFENLLAKTKDEDYKDFIVNND